MKRTKTVYALLRDIGQRWVALQERFQLTFSAIFFTLLVNVKCSSLIDI